LYQSDDTIEVGQDLYEIDTEAEASASASASASSEDSAAEAKPKEEESQQSSTEPEPEPAKASEETSETKAESQTSASTSQTSSHRSPSIQFLGKEGWARKLAGEETEETPQVYHIPPSYGRPAFSEEEMEALITGGANLAPQVKDYSSGAMFE
jgi:pyruvate/2-oxoglutarate dehydrogenase complex dihydrolipoamide acyltransferase (E2) component